MRKCMPVGFGVAILSAVTASLWPLESIMLGLTCVMAALSIAPLLAFAQSRSHFYWGLLAIGLLVSIAATNWPLRIAYAASSSSFNRVAQQIRSGQTISTPCMIGLFRISNAELHYNDTICFWTDCDPSGKTGFVQCGPDNPPFHLWSHTTLSDSWQFISED